MELQALFNELSSYEGINELKQIKKNDKEAVSFTFRNGMEVEITADMLYMTLSVFYKPKLLANGKIKKAYLAWANDMLTIPSQLESFFSIVSVGDAHVYSFLLAEEILSIIPQLLNSFIDDFVPSISEMIKGKVDFTAYPEDID